MGTLTFLYRWLPTALIKPAAPREIALSQGDALARISGLWNDEDVTQRGPGTPPDAQNPHFNHVFVVALRTEDIARAPLEIGSVATTLAQHLGEKVGVQLKPMEDKRNNRLVLCVSDATKVNGVRTELNALIARTAATVGRYSEGQRDLKERIDGVQFRPEFAGNRTLQNLAIHLGPETTDAEAGQLETILRVELNRLGVPNRTARNGDTIHLFFDPDHLSERVHEWVGALSAQSRGQLTDRLE